MIFKRISERIIESRATETLLLFRKEIAKRAKMDIHGKGPQTVYNDSMNLVIFEEGKTPYRMQSFPVMFDEIEKIYHKTWLSKLFGVDEKSKKRCFEKLLRSGALHPGKGENDFLFSMEDNMDLIDENN